MLKGLDKKDRKSLLKMLGRMEGNLSVRGAARVADEPEAEPQEDDEAE